MLYHIRHFAKMFDKEEIHDQQSEAPSNVCNNAYPFPGFGLRRARRARHLGMVAHLSFEFINECFIIFLPLQRNGLLMGRMASQAHSTICIVAIIFLAWLEKD